MTSRICGCNTILFFLLLAFQATFAIAAYQENNEKYVDDQTARADFRSKFHSSKPNDAISADAMIQAIAQVNELRNTTSEKAGLRPAVASAFFGHGTSVIKVGGIPVGPLPKKPPKSFEFPKSMIPTAFTDEQVNQLNDLATNLSLPLSSPINPGNWNWIGPGNIGGRIRSILIHPTNPTTLWIGSVAGGIWKSDDAGGSWYPLDDFMASLVVSSMVLDPINPDVIYAGTGEGLYNSNAFRGFGVFKSTDGGNSWSHLQSTNQPDFHWVTRLAISSDGAVLLVATRSGLYLSNDGGASFEVSKLGIADAAIEMSGEFLDVRFHPSDPNKCVASGRLGRSFYSENGGSNWHAAGGIQPPPGLFSGRVELAYAKANPEVVYASIDSGNGTIFRSIDGGKNYVLRAALGYLAGQGWYANSIWAGDPIDPNFLIVGGLDLHRSSDGGRTVTRISRWQNAPSSAHADHHVIVEHPAYDGDTNSIVYFGNDGGIYRANDVKTVGQLSGWTELNNGLGITQFYGAAGNINTGEIAGGTQDNGSLLYNPSTGPEQHATIFGGDGGYSAAHPSQRYFFGEYVYLQIHRSKDGNPSQYIFQGIADAGSGATALFISPFILDPNQPTRLYAGGAKLWRSENAIAAAPAWLPIKGATPPFNISAIDVAEGSPDHIWVGYELGSGAVEKTENGLQANPNWVRVGAGQLPTRHCTRISGDRSNTGRVFITYGGYEPNNLWQTDDGGQHWKAIAVAVLPEVPFYDLAIHPSDPNLLILGTEVGLFVSDDAGINWYPTNQGPTNCAVFELFWMNHTLVAVTHGRGIFKIDLSGHTPSPLMGFPSEKPVQAIKD